MLITRIENVSAIYEHVPGGDREHLSLTQDGKVSKLDHDLLYFGEDRELLQTL
jgi:hypothetical protein